MKFKKNMEMFLLAINKMIKNMQIRKIILGVHIFLFDENYFENCVVLMCKRFCFYDL